MEESIVWRPNPELVEKVMLSDLWISARGTRLTTVHDDRGLLFLLPRDVWKYACIIKPKYVKSK